MIYKTYNLQMSTLFQSIQLFNRCLSKIEKNQDKSLNEEQFILLALICFNLASKYQERVAFKVSELAKTAGLSLLEEESANKIRMLELKVL